MVVVLGAALRRRPRGGQAKARAEEHEASRGGHPILPRLSWPHGRTVMVIRFE
jgi:hypothetical protein